MQSVIVGYPAETGNGVFCCRPALANRGVGARVARRWRAPTLARCAPRSAPATAPWPIRLAWWARRFQPIGAAAIPAAIPAGRYVWMAAQGRRASARPASNAPRQPVITLPLNRRRSRRRHRATVNEFEAVHVERAGVPRTVSRLRPPSSLRGPGEQLSTVDYDGVPGPDTAARPTSHRAAPGSRGRIHDHLGHRRRRGRPPRCSSRQLDSSRGAGGPGGAFDGIHGVRTPVQQPESCS